METFYARPKVYAITTPLKLTKMPFGLLLWHNSWIPGMERINTQNYNNDKVESKGERKGKGKGAENTRYRLGHKMGQMDSAQWSVVVGGMKRPPRQS